MMVRAYVGLGSNLDHPEQQVRRALSELADLPSTRCVLTSPLYRSAPLGPADQPDYINAAAALDTELSPFQLLAALQAIETAHGRVRGAERWGPRTLDLDLLLYDQLVLATDTLTLPHPGLRARSFVLVPLLDIAPELVFADGISLSAVAAVCDRTGLARLD